MNKNTRRPRGAFFVPARRAPSSFQHVGTLAERLRDELALLRQPADKPEPATKPEPADHRKAAWA